MLVKGPQFSCKKTSAWFSPRKDARWVEGGQRSSRVRRLENWDESPASHGMCFTFQALGGNRIVNVRTISTRSGPSTIVQEDPLRRSLSISAADVARWKRVAREAQKLKQKLSKSKAKLKLRYS